MPDDPLDVTLPLSKELVLTVGLPEHYWLSITPNADRPPTLDGDGLYLSYLKNAKEGSTASIAYVGLIPLGESKPTDKGNDRVDRAAAGFLSRLRDDYAKFDLAL